MRRHEKETREVLGSAFEAVPDMTVRLERLQMEIRVTDQVVTCRDDSPDALETEELTIGSVDNVVDMGVDNKRMVAIALQPRAMKAGSIRVIDTLEFLTALVARTEATLVLLNKRTLDGKHLAFKNEEEREALADAGYEFSQDGMWAMLVTEEPEQARRVVSTEHTRLTGRAQEIARGRNPKSGPRWGVRIPKPKR